jgi:hypothetical protein
VLKNNKKIPPMGDLNARKTWSEHLAVNKLIDNVSQILSGSATADSAATLELFDEKIEWSHPANPQLIPFGGRHYGKKNVLSCLGAGNATIQTAMFQFSKPQYRNNSISCDFESSARVIKTGCFYTLKTKLLLELNEHGKIIRITQSGSVQSLENAFQGIR